MTVSSPTEKRERRVSTHLTAEQHQLLRQVVELTGSGTSSAALRQLVAVYAPRYIESLTAE